MAMLAMKMTTETSRSLVYEIATSHPPYLALAEGILAHPRVTGTELVYLPVEAVEETGDWEVDNAVASRRAAFKSRTASLPPFTLLI